MSQVQQLVQRFNKTNDKYEEILIEYHQLKEKLDDNQKQKLCMSNKILQLQEQIQRYKSLNIENDEQIVQVLTENECYHEFMFKQYSSPEYLAVIKSERQKIEQRQKCRMKKNKWATIYELIAVNEKLTAKLKLL